MVMKKTRPKLKKEEVKEEKEGIVETTIGSFSDPVNLIKKSGKNFFMGLLRVLLILLIISTIKNLTTIFVIQSIVSEGIQEITPELLSGLTESQLSILLATTPIFLIMQIIELITLIMIYQIVHNTDKGINTKIFENFKRIGIRGVILFIIIILINLSLFFTINLGLDVTIIGLILMLVLFLIQFMIVEIVVANNGIITSIKNSVVIVKNNISKTIIMNGILILVIIFITTSYTQVIQYQKLDFYLYVLMSIFMLILTSTLLMAPHYFFWSRVKSE